MPSIFYNAYSATWSACASAYAVSWDACALVTYGAYDITSVACSTAWKWSGLSSKYPTLSIEESRDIATKLGTRLMRLPPANFHTPDLEPTNKNLATALQIFGRTGNVDEKFTPVVSQLKGGRDEFPNTVRETFRAALIDHFDGTPQHIKDMEKIMNGEWDENILMVQNKQLAIKIYKTLVKVTTFLESHRHLFQ